MGTATTRRRVTPTGVLVLPADASTTAWLAARREGIGSSDIAAIMGVNPKHPASRVYYDKIGMLPLDDDDAGEPALWGKLHEETVAREWARRNRSVVRRVGLVAHRDEEWRRCTLDRRCNECPLNREQRETCAVEIKTRSAFKANQWRRDVPDDVLAQVLWQIAVTGYDHIHVAVLIGGNDYRQTVVRQVGNEQIIADIVAVARRFWFDHVQQGVEPDPAPGDDADALIDLYAALNPHRDGIVRLDDDFDVHDDIVEYEQNRLVESAAKKRKDAAKTRLVKRLGGAEIAVLNGDMAYSYEVSQRRTVDLERLAEEFPEAYEACVPDKPSRRLMIAKAYRLKPGMEVAA